MNLVLTPLKHPYNIILFCLTVTFWDKSMKNKLIVYTLISIVFCQSSNASMQRDELISFLATGGILKNDRMYYPSFNYTSKVWSLVSTDNNKKDVMEIAPLFTTSKTHEFIASTKDNKYQLKKLHSIEQNKVKYTDTLYMKGGISQLAIVKSSILHLNELLQSSDDDSKKAKILKHSIILNFDYTIKSEENDNQLSIFCQFTNEFNLFNEMFGRDYSVDLQKNLYDRLVSKLGNIKKTDITEINTEGSEVVTFFLDQLYPLYACEHCKLQNDETKSKMKKLSSVIWQMQDTFKDRITVSKRYFDKNFFEKIGTDNSLILQWAHATCLYNIMPIYKGDKKSGIYIVPNLYTMQMLQSHIGKRNHLSDNRNTNTSSSFFLLSNDKVNPEKLIQQILMFMFYPRQDIGEEFSYRVSKEKDKLIIISKLKSLPVEIREMWVWVPVVDIDNDDYDEDDVQQNQNIKEWVQTENVRLILRFDQFGKPCIASLYPTIENPKNKQNIAVNRPQTLNDLLIEHDKKALISQEMLDFSQLFPMEDTFQNRQMLQMCKETSMPGMKITIADKTRFATATTQEQKDQYTFLGQTLLNMFPISIIRAILGDIPEEALKHIIAYGLEGITYELIL